MKSTRLTRIEGTFMGIKFQVKPVPMNVEELDQQQRDMLMSWYEQNHPSLKEKLEQGADMEDYTTEEIFAISGWKKDVEFRAEYIKFLAESCMEFDRKVPEEFWAQDDLPYSVVREAWDFFTERRSA